jgi:deoxyribose-phosphate aldolase
MYINNFLEYTDLNINSSRKDINSMIEDSIKYQFIGICILPQWVFYAKNRIRRLGIKNLKIITVPNFSMGGGLEQCDGITDLVCDLADEIDFIWNVYEYSDLKAWDRIEKELKDIREKTKGKVLKIIIEAYYLRKMDENVYKLGLNNVFKEACRLVRESQANFIKSDSGLFKRPDFDTLLEDTKIIKKYSKDLQVKVSGGVSTKSQVEQLIKAGADRIGTSKALEIIQEK